MHDIRSATRSLLHGGTPEQLADAQQLLQETRRALYLILAGEPLSAASEEPAEDSAEPPAQSADEAAGPAMPAEMDRNAET